MQETFSKFMQTANRETYLRCYAQLVSSADYEPYSDEMFNAGELYEAGKLDKACEALQAAMGNLMLSPQAHRLLGFLLHELGDDKSAQSEMHRARTCLDGILASGDGSSHNPYIVARISDEREVIGHLGKELERQSLVEENGRHIDLLKCTDGTEYRFDITAPYRKVSHACR
ncbi:MAG: DUF4919 domain-containing protein [Deltaproteobacteria bacterium]|nr:DUF4919 domain-containing protein [Deltaproteobacteria bacterium]